MGIRTTPRVLGERTVMSLVKVFLPARSNPVSGRRRVSSLIAALTILLSSIIACSLGAQDSRVVEGDDDLAAGIQATSIISFTATPSRVYVGEEVTFEASASSTLPSATLHFVIFFDSLLSDKITNNTASPYYETTTTDDPATITAAFTYDHVGNLSGASGTFFVATLYVSDGSETSRTSIAVYVVENTAPLWELSLPPLLQFTVADDEFDGRTLTLDYSFLVVAARDVDNDSLSVTWDFGDGNVSVNETPPALNPVYVRQNHTWVLDIPPGMPVEGDLDVEFAVNVSVSDGNGHTIWKILRLILTVPENESPTISLSSQPSIPPLEPIVIRANVTDPEGDPLVWTFKYGDGVVEVFNTNRTAPNELVQMNVSHTYASIGTYVVVLNVSDALVPNQVYPHNISRSIPITVKANTVPAVSAINVLPDSPEVNLTTGVAVVRFSVQVGDADGDPLTITWDFGDSSDNATNVTSGGTAIFELTQVHNYTSTGTYNLTVVVADAYQNVCVYRVVNISSNNKPPNLVEVSFLHEGDIIQPNQSFELLVVISDPERDPIELFVDFGDDSEPIRVNLTDYTNGTVSFRVNHSYPAVGTYTVTLNFTDNMIGFLEHNKTSERTVVITVEAPNEAPVSAPGADQIVTVGATVTFDGSGSSDADGTIDNYTWEFTYDGVAEELYDESPTFDFDIVGTYTVTLTVTDDDGATDTDTMTVTVQPVAPTNEPPVADAGDDKTVTVGKEVTFDGSGSTDSDGTIVNYTWTFTYDGDTVTLYTASPKLTFEVAGTYTVTLTVTDDDGDTDTDSVKVTVEEDDEKSFLESYGLPLGLAIALIVAALVAFFVLKGRKGGKPEATELEGMSAGEPEPPQEQS
jgi:PKD repeat protein